MKEVHYEDQGVEIYLEYNIVEKFSSSLSFRWIPNETLKRDESFIEIVRGRREKERNFLRDSKFYDQRSFTPLLSPRKKRNDSSANARFFSLFEVFEEAGSLKKKREYVIYKKLN